tara:strand:+ start:343 stop:1485 length:1143 start_codon:yes stop_codon:yes gene_type:complete
MFIINEKIIFKKFLTENTYFFLLTAFSITFIVWVIQAVNNLEIVSEDGHSFFVYSYYTMLIFPKIFGKILPIIFFTSLYYTISRYEDNNELKIFWLNGINKMSFYNVILKYTFVFFFIQIIIVSFLGPISQSKARGYIQDSTLDFFPSLFQEKKFIDTVEGLTIFIESKNSADEFTNIFLKDDTSQYPKIIFAKKGFLLLGNDKRVLRLLDGKFININEAGSATSFNFKKTDFNLSKFLTKTTTHKKIQEISISRLIMCINHVLVKNENTTYEEINCNKESINEILSEVYKRIFKPLYLFLLSSIVIFLITSNYENKNFKKIKFLIFYMGVFSIIISEITVNYSGKSSLSMMLFIFLPLIIFLILSMIFYKKTNYKSKKL